MAKKKITKRQEENPNIQRVYTLQPGLGDFGGNRWPFWK